MEVDILEDGSLDQDVDLLERLDVVVASVHSKLRMPEQEMTRRMVMAVASPHVDILGHCTGRKVVGTGRPQSQFDPDIVFAACARFGTAVEINCRPERQDPPEELLQLALDWDCRISIDTDAHAPRPARVADLRLRQGGPHGHRARAHRQHDARRRPRRLDRDPPHRLTPKICGDFCAA